MSAPKGMKLGPYEVVAALGAGGMGEVYRARDTRLGREVAIKILPSAFSSDISRLRRFEQEARAAAALNHPNILAVHDIGTYRATATDATAAVAVAQESPYIVSELLQGETLRERLRNGALPVRKAIDYAQQMVHGLAAAHDMGIVHRDLKPENIFITEDGRVKILDFGLAKLVRPEVGGEGQTLTQSLDSEAGAVLGTVGYMSPEQVRGKPADARSDLFSFGTILYEMLSGKRAFHGESAAETMSAIAKEEPPDLTETNRAIPPALERVVRHCLEKNPAERFQSARDLAFALENISQTSQTAIALPTTPRKWKVTGLMPLLWVGILFVVAAGAVLAWRGTHSNSVPTFRRLTFERGLIVSARFAADGGSVIYGASWENNPIRLFSTPIDSPQARPLEIESASLLGISRSGEMALAVGGKISSHLAIRDATLARAPIAGGAPRELLEQVRTADWGPDGSLAVVHYVNGRSRVEYPVGKVLYETGGWISHMRISPAGDRIAFMRHPVWPDDRGYVAMVDLAGHEQDLTQEWESEEGLAWSSKGNEVWFTATSAGSDRALYALNRSGKVRVLLRIPGGLTLHDIAPDGRVLLSFDGDRVGMRAAREGGAERDLSWLGWTIPEAISPDNKWILFSEEGEPAGNDYILAMRSFDGSAPKVLGQGYGAFGFSPDGKWAAATDTRRTPHVTLIPIGPGQANKLDVTGLDQIASASFFPDGKQLLVIGAEHGHAYRTYILPITGGKSTAVTPEGVISLVLSKDGKELAARDLSGSIVAYSLAGQAPQNIPGTSGLLPLQWSEDGRFIYATAPDEIPGRLLRIARTSGRQELLRRFTPGDSAGVYNLFSILVNPDGRSYAYSYRQTLSTLYVAEGVQ